MTEALTLAGLAMLVVVVSARPHGWGPPIGATLAVALAIAAGTVEPDDLERAAAGQWRPFVTLIAVMTMTAAAEQLGLLDRLAAVIEPRTRGPVRHAFRTTFVLSALVAAIFSNDAAILLLPPTILTLLRTVYPKRHGKFLAPFAFAVFAAAGVAPLVISNPMNLVFADHVGLGFNAYSAVMIPVALASWVTTYAVLAWCFRDVLADEAPALGAWPGPPAALTPAARAVLAVAGAVLLAYPAVSYLEQPLWPVAAGGAVACAAIALAAGIPLRKLAGGVSWSVFPFLTGVFVLALALDRAGIAAHLTALYESRPDVATVGVASAIGSALLNNHPMSLLNAFAFDRMAGESTALHFAALVGGDLGPRLLPMGSLAGLLWFDVLRRHGVTVPVATFVRVGLLVTVPSLAVSLVVLWLVT